MADTGIPAIPSMPVMTGQGSSSSGSKILVVGDLHISDKYSGRHVDYFKDCTEFLTEVTDIIRDRGITQLILTGDVIGRTTEKNLQSRESLMYFMKVLQVWNQLTKGNVYSIRGNHDMSQRLTDFDLFVSLGLIQMLDQLDVGAIRFHLMNYGDHKRPIEVDESRYNVAIMHTDLQVEGLTDWYRSGSDGVELSSLENLYGVDLVLAGHIHNPSPRLLETSIRDKSIQLFYPGNATRPKWDKELWEKCFSVMLETDGEDVSIAQIEHKLKPVDEVFQKTYDDIEESEDGAVVGDQAVLNIEQLSQILEELKSYNILGEADYKTQIIKLGGIDKEAVDLALKYIEEVEGEMK